MPEEVAAQFLERLWQIQADRNLSNRRLAVLIGVSPPYIGRLKRGVRGKRLSIDFAVRVARAIPELSMFLSNELPIVDPDSTISNSGDEEVCPR